MNVSRKIFLKNTSWETMNDQVEEFQFDLEDINDDKYDNYFHPHDDGTRLSKPLRLTLCKFVRVNEKQTLFKNRKKDGDESEDLVYNSLMVMKLDELRETFKGLTTGNYKLVLSIGMLENEDGEEPSIIVEDIKKI